MTFFYYYYLSFFSAWSNKNDLLAMIESNFATIPSKRVHGFNQMLGLRWDSVENGGPALNQQGICVFWDIFGCALPSKTVNVVLTVTGSRCGRTRRAPPCSGPKSKKRPYVRRNMLANASFETLDIQMLARSKPDPSRA